MKKQYVNGYGKENKNGDKWSFVLFAIICIAVFVFTVVVAGIIIDSPKSEYKEGSQFVEETPEEDIAVVKKEHTPKAEPVSALVVEEEPQGYITPCDGGLLKEYADEMPIYSETLDDWRLHEAVDISAPIGAEVRAIADGTVLDIYEDFRNGYTISVDHGEGLVAYYSNLDTMGMTEKGAKVKRGQQISAVGDTTLFETVADTHLHFETKLHGRYVNPLNYITLTE